eukprot:TRINITY_DN10753_c0_g1_i1.p1 TRINITY_DN10753_c0_g1~~TRINITY_DN10753_c0_g1_i1.p1  ORF type:complete len:257 (+),score=39.99 TRINITY_DN10753_c0_g1_i1:45-815(+)
MMQTVLFAAAVAVVPPQWMIDADKKFGELYNAQNFTGVQSIYNPGAELIPPTADGFLLGNKLAPFFKQAYDGGLRNLSLTPTHVLQESDTLWHEIGESSDSTGKGTYYVRWVKPADVWEIAFDCMSIGVPSNSSGSSMVKDQPPSWMVPLLKKSMELWNSGKYDELAGMYNPGAQFVPYSADSYILQPQLATYFKKIGDGVTMLKNEFLTGYQESPKLYHAIGLTTTKFGTSKWYLRYIQLDSGEWQVAFELSVIN